MAITGYGLVRQLDELALEDWGVITTPAGMALPERLLKIHAALQDIIRAARPDAMAVEELFFSRNVRTAMAVGQARGVVLLTAAQHGLPVHEYKPTEVKQAVAGYGGADKGQVQEMVRLLLGLDDVPRPDDAADAIAVAICHIHAGRLRQLIDGDL